MADVKELTVREGALLAQRYPLADRQTRACGAYSPEAVKNGAYICTRPKDHGHGPHVAHASDLTAVATWEVRRG